MMDQDNSNINESASGESTDVASGEDKASQGRQAGQAVSESGQGGAYQDKTLTCRDCSQEFVWTAGEQDFYAQKGFDNPPSRCRICRGKYKAAREQFGRVESKITCKKCGKESTVPFVPRDPATVLCRDCFQAEKGQR